MVEQIEVRDIEESARLVKIGRNLLKSLKETRARLEVQRKLAFEEVEHRRRLGDIDGMLTVWEEHLQDIDADLLEDEREIQEVKDEVEEVEKEHEALVAVHNEFLRLKTTIKK